jgi:MFS family permease
MIRRSTRKLALGLVLASIAVAFADSSIVVLALPDLLKQFGRSITDTAWVVTAYNLALAVSSFALIRSSSRQRSVRLVRPGLALFALSSFACGTARNLWTLVIFRTAQGIGGALLLAGSLALANRLVANRDRGRSLWIGAGVLGTALGPAAGGLLTGSLGWRAIFFAQAPVAGLALAGTVALAGVVREPTEETEVTGGPKAHAVAANVSLGLISAALVGLLFLAVVLLVDVWRFSPLGAAAAVSVIPLATLLTQALGMQGGLASMAGGVLSLSLGLAGMALVPAHGIGWILSSLALSGFGFGLVVPGLSRIALARGSPASAVWTVGSRHAGLVAGLLLLTPVLASDLTSAGEHAKLQATSVVLDMPATVRVKLGVAFDLIPFLDRRVSEGLPDFASVSATHRTGTATTLGDDLNAIARAAVTRSFRPSFLLAALLAALSIVPLLALAPSRISVAFRDRALLIPLTALVAGGALLGAEAVEGSLSLGSKPELPGACTPRNESVPSISTAQRIALTSLDMIACRFHENREQLVVNLASRGADASKITALLGSNSGSISRLWTLFSHLTRSLG